MSENTIKNSELEELGIMLAEEVLEIGIQDDYADKIAADYVEKIANAKNNKDSVFYKSFKIKELYKESDMHKSINLIINKLEPLRVAIMRDNLALKQAVAEGNQKLADESIKAVAKKKVEKSKLDQKLNMLIGNTNELKLVS